MVSGLYLCSVLGGLHDKAATVA